MEDGNLAEEYLRPPTRGRRQQLNSHVGMDRRFWRLALSFKRQFGFWQPLCIGDAAICRDRHGHNQQRHDRKEGHENCDNNRRPLPVRINKRAPRSVKGAQRISHQPRFC